ncbi:MAG: hypothetical protein LBC39_02700 [Methanobrevibacter sp.]|jgi:hypothetical protein|nr:hypothetical protein [Candidatus Methanovirga aequatorialis]
MREELLKLIEERKEGKKITVEGINIHVRYLKSREELEIQKSLFKAKQLENIDLKTKLGDGSDIGGFLMEQFTLDDLIDIEFDRNVKIIELTNEEGLTKDEIELLWSVEGIKEIVQKIKEK